MTGQDQQDGKRHHSSERPHETGPPTHQNQLIRCSATPRKIGSIESRAAMACLISSLL
jgi:hypothetical protein